jgi:hypothetical protein
MKKLISLFQKKVRGCTELAAIPVVGIPKFNNNVSDVDKRAREMRERMGRKWIGHPAHTIKRRAKDQSHHA